MSNLTKEEQLSLHKALKKSITILEKPMINLFDEVKELEDEAMIGDGWKFEFSTKNNENYEMVVLSTWRKRNIKQYRINCYDKFSMGTINFLVPVTQKAFEKLRQDRCSKLYGSDWNDYKTWGAADDY